MTARWLGAVFAVWGLGCEIDLPDQSLGDDSAGDDDKDSAGDKGDDGTSGGSGTSGRTPAGSSDGSMACTEIGCVDGLIIDILAEPRFVPGRYEIGVLRGDAGGGCLLAVDVEQRLETFGCELISASPTRASVRLPPAEGTWTISIRRSGLELDSVTVDLEYEVSRPNGPGCEPECRTARVEIEAPWDGGQTPGAGCEIDGEVYENGGPAPDPYSCNSCQCQDGRVDQCTEIGCVEDCPEGTQPTSRCVACGAAGGCDLVRIGCEAPCQDDSECGPGGRCLEGTCALGCI